MNQTQVKLSIIIPHHGGFNILHNCLTSLYKSNYKNYEIIVVDNNSQDNSIERIKDNFSEVKIISLKTLPRSMICMKDCSSNLLI